jgi:hypothetical protein
MNHTLWELNLKENNDILLNSCHDIEDIRLKNMLLFSGRFKKEMISKDDINIKKIAIQLIGPEVLKS